jgi:fibronectin type 3 domain-containing protein
MLQQDSGVLLAEMRASLRASTEPKVTMKSPSHRTSQLIAFGFITVFMVLLPRSGNGQTPPPVPSTYQDLYTTLQTDLDAFNTTLNSVWNGSTYATAFAGNLHSANGNSGPSLATTYYSGATLELQALKAIGVQAVMVQVGFPILYQPFYDFLATQPGYQQVTYNQFATYYQQVAQNVHTAGLKLIVENDTLLSNDAQAGWGPAVTPYYATLNWTQYQAARAQCALTVAQVMQPDYLVVLEEPDTESAQTGQTNVATSSGATSMLTQMLTALQPVQGTVKVGAGVANWETTYQSYIQSFVTLPLDFIDMHVYPINNIGPPNNVNFVSNAMSIASIAAAAGKPITVTESWLWKMRDSEWGVLTADDIRARGAYSFWEPLDDYFLQTMENLAYYTQMPFMATANFENFWAYVDYGSSTENLSTTDLLNLQTTLGGQAVPEALFSPTAMSYYSSLVSPADTIPPSTPTNLTGTPPTATTANLSWTGSTDNIGVAGYYVLRNGTQITSTAQTFFQDSGLTQNTTYVYQIEAFDLGGNVSPPVQVSITTPNATIPNPPANLTGTAISCQQITLSWSVPPGNIPINSYLLFQGSAPANLTQTGQLSGTTLSSSVYQLTPGTTYYFGVEAVSSGLVSPMATVAVTTLAPPSTPTNLVATPASSVRVGLTWSASTGGMPIASYHVYRGSSASNLAQISATTATSFTDTTVSPATTYYYAVQATDTGGDLSPMSSTVTAVVPALPAAPTAVTAAANSGSKVTVNWSEATAGMPIASYRVFRGSSPSNLSQVATTTATSYIDTSVSASTTYYYAAEAVDTGGDVSPMSTTVAVTTPGLPSVPANVAATAPSAVKVSVTWLASTGSLPIASYRVFRGSSASSLVQAATRATTSYTDTTVSPATLYYYAVEAVDTAGDVSPMSADVQVTTPVMPSAPANLAATAISSYKIGLSWSAPTGGLTISSYRVFRGSSPSNLSQAGTTTKTSYTDSSLTPGTTYYYAVEAADSGGDVSPMSGAISATTPVLPSAPAGVTATPISSYKISVKWSASTGGLPIANYRVFRGTSAASLSQVATTTNTSYTDTSLSPATTYYYAVEAADTAGDVSAMSAVVSATSPVLPSAPTNLTATPLSAAKVSLTWSASTGGLPIANYRIFRGSSPSSLTQLATTTKTSYTDTSVSQATTYYYALEAADTGGDVSPMSNTVQVSAPALPPAPTGVTATAVSNKQVSLTWSAVTADLPITSYRIYRGSSATSLIQVSTRTSTSYSDTAVTSATTYYYAVQAVDSGGDVSSMSAVVSATTPN